MAVQRRNLFGLGYGSAKIDHARPRPMKAQPQIGPPVPLPITAQATLPNGQGGAQQPAQGGEQPLPPELESVLQQMLTRFGGQHG